MEAAPRIKIAAVTPYFPVSATSHRGHSAFHTLRFLKHRADIQVICPIAHYPKWLSPDAYKDPPDLTYQPPELKTTYFEYPAVPLLTRPVNGFICARYLRPYLRSISPDIILNYWLYPEGYSAVRVGRSLGIPVIAGAIGSDIRRINDPFTVHFVRRTLLEASAVITVSEELRQRAIGLGVPGDRVTTILNGCDTTVFHPNGNLSAGENELILYVGNVIPSKGVLDLIEAFIGLTAFRPQAKLAIIGDGEAAATLKTRAAEAGIPDRLLMLGRRKSPEVAEWMRKAAIFCLPSHSEGCPNVIVEALACGRPIVATNVGGIPELVDQQCGILVPPHDPVQLRQALENALSRSWDAAEIAATYRRGWDEVADKTYDVCLSVLQHV
jgi:glycosyltransferase involved in cell wall biosynthesis